MQDFNGNDTINHRVYELENGNKLHLRRVDPYGFIHLNLDKGQLPAWAVNSAYTDWTQARIAAEKYLKERKTALEEIAAKEAAEAERPVLKLKPGHEKK